MYKITYGLDDSITFEQLEQATIFTLGLTAKGESFMMEKIIDRKGE